MLSINKGIQKLALYEFRYALDHIIPPEGWCSVQTDEPTKIEEMIQKRDFYTSIQLKAREEDRFVLDPAILRLTRMLLAGLVEGRYSEEWLNKLFYFDIRGFFFLPRSVYFTEAALAHFGGKPYRKFTPGQKCFDDVQDISYLDFQEANTEVDQAFIQMMLTFTRIKGTPLLITLAGPTAAGKTEITERLMNAFTQADKKTTSIEMDNFMMDRDFREGKPIDRTTIHFTLFQQSLQDILQGKKVTIPCYDSSDKTSSHDLQGNLRAGRHLLEVLPADIIFLEGNFPFQMPEIRERIQLLIVYLTDDPIRLKRKWKRDVDYRKNYEPAHFCNRFFVTQFMRADDCYRSLIETCDMVVDTTGAAVWTTPEIAQILMSK
jgi:uridine kinase